MSSLLQKIIEYKKAELAAIKRKVSFKDVKLKSQDTEPACFFLKEFRDDQINIIAEIKKASPSAGIIRKSFDPISIALDYRDHGAKALSVVTDQKFFKGHLEFIAHIKKRVALPCLRKDFTLTEYHIYEARGAKADAILLIASILDKHQIKDYQDLAGELGMMALVEVHSLQDLNKVIPCHPQLVGVNNRDLNTFKTSLKPSFDLVKNIPHASKKISESGLQSHEDLIQLKQAGFDGFLIGESLMRATDIGKKLTEMVKS